MKPRRAIPKPWVTIQTTKKPSNTQIDSSGTLKKYAPKATQRQEYT